MSWMSRMDALDVVGEFGSGSVKTYPAITIPSYPMFLVITIPTLRGKICSRMLNISSFNYM